MQRYFLFSSSGELGFKNVLLYSSSEITMAIILHIETSTTVCSVALSQNGSLISNHVSYDGPSHASLAGVFVKEALSALPEGRKPDAVAVSGGPGSYTGLRIGVSLAKGLCFGYKIPLIAIPTLKIMASHLNRLKATGPEALLCPMIDARRMEVYCALFDSRLQVVRPTGADIITEDSYSEYLHNGKVLFFGNGASKCKELIRSENAVFIDDIHPLAADMVLLAEAAFETKDFADTAYYEPFYLKDFVATVAKNKVLGNS